MYWPSQKLKDNAQLKYDKMLLTANSSKDIIELDNLKSSLKLGVLKDKIKFSNRKLNVFNVRGLYVSPEEFDTLTKEYLNSQVQRLQKSLDIQNEKYKAKGNHVRIRTLGSVIGKKSLVTEYLFSLPLEYWDDSKIIKFDSMKTPFTNMNGQLIDKWFVDKVLNPEKLKLWEDITVSFIKNELIRITGTDTNYISHTVHNDERQPHIHLYMHNLFDKGDKTNININGFLSAYDIEGGHFKNRQKNFTIALAKELNVHFDALIVRDPYKNVLASENLSLETFISESKGREIRTRIFHKNIGIAHQVVKEADNELNTRIGELHKAVTLNKPMAIAVARSRLEMYLSVNVINDLENDIRTKIEELEYNNY